MTTNQRNLTYLELMGIQVYSPRSYGELNAFTEHEAAAESSTKSAEVALERETAVVPRSEAEVEEVAPAMNSHSAISTPAEPEVPLVQESWEGLQREVAACTKCALCDSRSNTVFGVGNAKTDILFIGEAPGAEEDRRGEPFVGRAGQLLDEMMASVGLDRSKAFIANILKCRPPNNRDPKAEEVAQCFGYLERQINFIDPKVIVVLGRIAAQNLLKSELNMGQLRRQQHVFGQREIPVVATYHPAYLLRSPSQKKASWQDFVLVKKLMERIAC